MANLDAVKNFALVVVSTGYDASATSIALQAGDGAKLPQPSTDGEFNVVWWNATDYGNPSLDPNVEIVRVTARATDTLTVTRAQESISATTKNTVGKTYKMSLAITAKMIEDIETALNTTIVKALEEDGNGDLQPITTTPTNDHDFELDGSDDIQPTLVLYDEGLMGNINSGDTPEDYPLSDPTYIQSISIPSPTGAEDRTIFFTDRAITISKITTVIRGSSTPYVVWYVKHSSNRDMRGQDIRWGVESNINGGTTKDTTTQLKALTLNGSNKSASIADGSQTGLDITGNLTVEAWIKLEKSTTVVIASKWDDSPQNGWIFRYDLDATQFTFLISSTGSGGETQSSSATTLLLGRWYHVAMSYEASSGNTSFYLNGVLINTFNGVTTSIFNNTAPFVIGVSSLTGGGSQWFGGQIREVRVWNTNRTAAQISANMDVDLVGTETNLQGLWKLNVDLQDLTSNNNDLTANNSASLETVTNNAIPANSFVWLETATESGTTDELAVTVKYTLDT